MAAEYIAPIPPGYEDSELVLMPDNRVLMLHPMQPPLVLLGDGTWLDLNLAPVHPAQTHSS